MKIKLSTTMLHTTLSWSVVAFTVATVILAVQTAKLDADLQDAKQKLDYLESQLEGEVKPLHTLRATHSTDEDETIDYRLPASLAPINYDLYLHPDLETGTFSGQEIVQISVLEATEQIILHAHKLTISSVYALTSGGGTIEVAEYYLDEVREFLVVNLRQALTVGSTIRLGVIFEGQMRDKLNGLYSSTYLTAEQVRRTIATSKFEPTYARQAFPCFDEPAMKATFDVTLIHPTGDNYHALSNMNEQSSQLMGAYTEVRFARSVAMSTYLACFLVSDFSFITKGVETQGLGENFDIRLYATSHQVSKVQFALDTAVAATEFYIQYFKVEYPLPKLDMAAIPDFASNAMEHWGLVTYRETALLYDRSVSSTWNKQRVAAVVAHELAHMWFGNLVTMMWWNDIWLNEGFARYMEYKATNEVYPDWGMPDQFLIHALHSVMKFDSTVASHPIIKAVENPAQITEMFDTISYEKGASVIRMLEEVVGADTFGEAVTNYLNNFQYKNAVTDDFISEVANLISDFDVRLFMRTWTEQMGMPVVEVSRTTTTSFTVKQKRFLSNIEDYNVIHNDSEFNYTWTIPLTYYTDSNKDVQHLWYDHDVSEVVVPVATSTKWLKFNIHQVGYYRVNYEESIWQDIIADLVASPMGFDISDRAHLLNDVFALADASQLSYDIALDATKYLEQETDFVPWYVATAKLQALQLSLMKSDSYVDYVQYARSLITKIYDEVTWTVDDDNHLKNRLRVSILTASCALGLPDCLEQAASRFNAWLADPTNKPDSDLREIIYYYGMQHVGTEKEWDQMWDLFVAELDATEKLKLMYGLSGVREPWLLYRFIELAADETYVRGQDYYTCLQNIAANPAGEPVVWDYVREYWPEITARFGLNDRYLGRMIPTITERFSSETKLEEMQSFFEKYPEAGAGTASRGQALETVKFNIIWLQKNEEQVANWLKAQ